MRKIYLLFLLVFMAIKFNAHAERINIPGLEIPKLIITEVRPDAEPDAYIELTNVGDTPIDLEPFTLHSVFYNTRIIQVSDSIILFNRLNAADDGTIDKVYLKGVVQPGESFVITSVWDGQNARVNHIPNHNTALAQIANQFVFKAEPNNTIGWILKPEWQCFGFDSLSTPEELLRAESSAGYLIQWKFQVDSVTWDSTYIDQFNFFHFPEQHGQGKGPDIFPIAGVADAMTTGIMVPLNLIMIFLWHTNFLTVLLLLVDVYKNLFSLIYAMPLHFFSDLSSVTSSTSFKTSSPNASDIWCFSSIISFSFLTVSSTTSCRIAPMINIGSSSPPSLTRILATCIG